jgi:hypothetical protein
VLHRVDEDLAKRQHDLLTRGFRQLRANSFANDMRRSAVARRQLTRTAIQPGRAETTSMSSFESSLMAASRTTEAISSASKGGVKHPKTRAGRAAMMSFGVL